MRQQQFRNSKLAVVTLVVATIAAVGWTQAPTVPEPAGNEALGIAEFQVNETDSSLVIAGLDAQKKRVAQVEVKIGRFVMSDAFAEDRTGAAIVVEGRRIDIEVGARKLNHESAGYGSLRIPLPPMREYRPMAAFLTDPRVAQVLGRYGVAFRSRWRSAVAGPGEVADDSIQMCSDYNSHYKGPGLDCDQYRGNEPSGFTTNTCNSQGMLSLGCADTSIADPNYGDGFYTDLFQVCDAGEGFISVSEKKCVSIAGGDTPCGRGGAFGCADCWIILDPGVQTADVWCEGAGDSCRELSCACGASTSGIDMSWTLPTNALYGVWGSEASDVWAVGDGGAILHWDGSAWMPVPSGTTDTLLGVWGSGASDVWAVGLDGTIFHWDGIAWTSVSSGTSLTGVWGSEASDVWAVGGSGTILHWDGSAWTGVSSGTTNKLNSVWGSGASDVWAVGRFGTILHSEGSAWTTISSGTTNTLYGVWGSGVSDVWAVGLDGTIVHWDGSAWMPVPSGTTDTLLGVWGSGASDVWAVGFEGTILHWDGSAWTSISSGTAYGLVDMSWML